MPKVRAKHISGLDDKVGRRIAFISLSGSEIAFQDLAGDDVAHLQTASVKEATYSKEKAESGILKRTKEVARLRIEYQTKSGAIKTICLEPLSFDDGRLIFGALMAIKEAKQKLQEAEQKRAEYLNGRQEFEENIHVRGESFYKESFEALAIPNPFYDMSKSEMLEDDFVEERIFEYDFEPKNVELRPEPENEYDPNAVAVWVDGYQVGYVPRGSCSHVKKILGEYEVEDISAKIGGGRYKYLFFEGDDEYDFDESPKASDYTIEKDKLDYSVVVTIKYLK